MNEVEALEQIKSMLEIKENFSISDSVRKDTRYNLLKEVEALKIAIKLFEKQSSKKPAFKKFQYPEHKWRLDENGEIDEFAYECDYHNGPVCERCYYSFCEHCNPDGYKDNDCTFKEWSCASCGKEVFRSQTYCKCGQKLDWS